MRWWNFLIVATIVAVAVFAGIRFINNDYYFFAGYTVLQFIVLATAWNILGGYTGYVNFGSAAFFAPPTAVTPRSGLPPRMVNMSIRGPQWTAGSGQETASGDELSIALAVHCPLAPMPPLAARLPQL